jgi:hypothetical protein
MAAGRTTDPSASLGMTRGEGWLRLQWLADERNSRSLHYIALRFGMTIPFRCQNLDLTINLSSRPERSAVEGPAISLIH